MRGGREVQEGKYISIPVADLLCCMAETQHNILKQFSRLLKSGKENKKGFSMGDIVMTVYNASKNLSEVPQNGNTQANTIGMKIETSLLKYVFEGNIDAKLRG